MAGLNDEQKKQVEEIVAQKFDILSAFRELPEWAFEQIAQDIERFTYSRQLTLRKPENTYTPRITVADQDINTDDNGVLRGHAGPTMPRWINFVNGSGSLDPEDFAKVNLSLGSGADCMFDFITSPCFADEGWFTEGMTFKTLSGCTFKGYSTIAGACTAASALSTGAHPVIFICSGSYTEDASITGPSNDTVRIVGAGRNAVTWTGSASAGDALACTSASVSIVLSDVTITSHNSATASALNGDSGSSSWVVERCAINSASTANSYAIVPGNPGVGWRLTNCNISGSGIGIGDGSASGDSSTIAGAVFMESCEIDAPIGIRSTNDGNFHGVNCAFRGAIGIQVTGTFTATTFRFSKTLFSCTTAGYQSTGGGSLSKSSFINCNFDDCTKALDFGTTANAAINNVIEGCLFETDTGTDIAIDDTSGALRYSIIVGNTFEGYNTGNEIVSVDETDNVIAHNISDAGSLPDTHAEELGFGGSGGFPHQIIDADGDTYLRMAETAAGDQDTWEGAAGGTSILKATATNFDFLNAIDFRVYSDAGSTLKMMIDGASGEILFGTASTVSGNAFLVSGTTASGWTTIVKTSPIITAATNTVIGGDFNPDVTRATDDGLETTGVYATPTIQLSAAVTHTKHQRAMISGYLVVAGSGQFDEVSAWQAFNAIQSGTVDVMRGIHMPDVTVLGGTVNTLYGIDIAAFSGATTNVGIRNASASRLVAATTIGADAAVSSGLILDITGVVGQKAGSAYRWYDSDSSHYAGLKANGTTTASIEYTLPAAGPAADDALLGSTTAGAMSWFPAATTTEIADVTGTESAGTSDTYARGDHVHAASAAIRTTTLNFIIDGGGAEIADGIVPGDVVVDFACTIQSATLLADQSGSIVLDIWVEDYANYPPTVADTITASAKPTISTATKSQDSTLTGWTTSIAAGDTIRINVDSCTTITYATLSLKLLKTG